MPMTLCLQELWACFKMPTCHWPKAYQISAMALSKHLFTVHNYNITSVYDTLTCNVDIIIWNLLIQKIKCG